MKPLVAHLTCLFVLLVTYIENLSAAETLPELLQKLDHENHVIRHNAIQSIGKLGPAAHDATYRIIGCLDDQAVSCRLAAVYALGSLESKEAAPYLQALQSERDSTIKQAASRSLTQLGPLTEEELEWLRVCGRYVLVAQRKIEIPAEVSKNIREFAAKGSKAQDIGYLATPEVGKIGLILWATVNEVVDECSMHVDIEIPTRSNAIQRSFPATLAGFSTTNLANGSKWNGPQGERFIGIVAGLDEGNPVVVPCRRVGPFISFARYKAAVAMGVTF